MKSAQEKVNKCEADELQILEDALPIAAHAYK